MDEQIVFDHDQFARQLENRKHGEPSRALRQLAKHHREKSCKRTFALLLFAVHQTSQSFHDFSTRWLSKPTNAINHSFSPDLPLRLPNILHHMKKTDDDWTRIGFEIEVPEDDAEEDYDEDDAAETPVELTSLEQMATAVFRTLDATPPKNLTVAEIKKHLQTLGLKTSGKKSDLLERLAHMRRKLEAGVAIHDAEVKADPNFRWYALQTANGFEGAVERNLNTFIVTQKLKSKIKRVWVPILDGETSVRDSSVMPSYIYVRMKMDTTLYEIISQMQYVVNFVGFDHGGKTASGNMIGNRGFVRPLPLTDDAFESIAALTKANNTNDDVAREEPVFIVGDVVEVRDGPFQGMRGPILSLDGGNAEEEKETLDLVTLSLPVMGKLMNVSVPLKQCRKELQ